MRKLNCWNRKSAERVKKKKLLLYYSKWEKNYSGTITISLLVLQMNRLQLSWPPSNAYSAKRSKRRKTRSSLFPPIFSVVSFVLSHFCEFTQPSTLLNNRRHLVGQLRQNRRSSRAWWRQQRKRKRANAVVGVCVRQDCPSASTSTLFTVSLSSAESVWGLSLYFLLVPPSSPGTRQSLYIAYIHITLSGLFTYCWQPIWAVFLVCCKAPPPASHPATWLAQKVQGSTVEGFPLRL